MPGMKEIKNRINSVSDTQKITNAMYLIASTKLRKAMADLEETRPFFDAVDKEIERIFRVNEKINSRYFYPAEKDEDGKTGKNGYLVITADKGLAGAYNHNVTKLAIDEIGKTDSYMLFVVGEVGRHYFSTHNIDIEKSFLYTAQNPSFTRALDIADILLEKYNSGELSSINIIYTDMKNSVSQEPKCERLLPICRDDFIADERDNDSEEFEFMPKMEEVLDSIVPAYITGFVYGALVDSFCSEQNARMQAMDSANSNAEDLLAALKLQYNHVRQDAITREITEVAAGAKAKRKKMEREKEKRKRESE